MRGIVLAGGTGSRLEQLTRVTSKHLLPIGNLPMLYWPLARLYEANITDVCIVSGVEHIGDVIETLGSGDRFSMDFTYKVQEKPGGIAEALGLAEDFASGGEVVVILGDNMFSNPIDVSPSGYDAVLYIKEVGDPGRFGVAELDTDKGFVIGIEEKPTSPKTNFAVTGLYKYTSEVFDIIKTLQPSARGEKEITDVNNRFIESGSVPYIMIEGDWLDAGTLTSYHRASRIATSWNYQFKPKE